MHVRTYIKVEINPVTILNCDLPKFALCGNERIGQIKRMAFEHLVPQIDADGDPLLNSAADVESCQLLSSGLPLEDNLSLYEVCLLKYDAKFDPMYHELELEMAIDNRERLFFNVPIDLFIVLVIILNTIFMSVDYYDAPDSFRDVLEMAEHVFNAIFTIEMFFKIYALKGFGTYWAMHSNKFDFLIVLSSWTNTFIEATGLNFTFMRVLRIVRAFRVTRVVRKIDSVKVIVDAAFNSMQPIVNIMMFMLVVLVVYSCMGMQLYGSAFNFDGEIPRENFGTYPAPIS